MRVAGLAWVCTGLPVTVKFKRASKKRDEPTPPLPQERCQCHQYLILEVYTPWRYSYFFNINIWFVHKSLLLFFLVWRGSG